MSEEETSQSAGPNSGQDSAGCCKIDKRDTLERWEDAGGGASSVGENCQLWHGELGDRALAGSGLGAVI